IREEALPTTSKQLSTLLFRQLRAERCLLVLDRYDALVEAGGIAGTYRIGYEEYAHWLRQLAELSHRSCIVVTSREKPLEFMTFSNDSGPVRSLMLSGLDVASLRTMLEPRGLYGTAEEWQQIHRRYSGNPAALTLAADPVNELFGGSLAAFLNSEVALFQAIRDLLDQQFGRLSLLEREVLYWLVIEREAVPLETLQDNIGKTVPKLHLLEAVRSLLRRSIIEQQFNRFVVPEIVQAYINERFIELVVNEISAGIPLMVAGFAVVKTQMKEYLREAQIRETIQPILARLFRFADRQEIEAKLSAMLKALQQTPSYAGNYCAGNLFNLLVQINTDLRSHDFSHLEIYQGDLRTTNLQDTNFSYSTFHASRFWESFASIAAIAFNPAGTYIAAGMTTGELYLWSLKGWELLYCIPGHSDMIWSITFSSDGTLLATGSEDQTACVWDVASGECLLRVAAHEGWVKSVSFLNDSAQLVTAGHDGKIRLWDVTTGECLKSWQAHDGWIWSIAISPTGELLASAGQDHQVKLWDLQTFSCVRVLARHTEPVRTVAFSPDSQMVLSAGFDRVIAIWEVATGHCRHLLQGHENLIWSAAFSPDGTEIV
ncbi:MAG: WD40 repeat domain-containing protein, partial [Caldilineaceae bacterium]|nr:WD40 repeat domain-containing protein [Caldilineaceae bacterium]